MLREAMSPPRRISEIIRQRRLQSRKQAAIESSRPEQVSETFVK